MLKNKQVIDSDVELKKTQYRRLIVVKISKQHFNHGKHIHLLVVLIAVSQ